MSFIVAKDLSYSRGPQEILKNVSFEIQEGESIAVIGPSGSGKTSLLKLLCGLLTPQNGSIFYEQTDLSTLSVERRQELVSKMGVLFQKNALFDSMTCLENIVFPLREEGKISESDMESLAKELLQAVGIDHAAHLYPHEISGGMQKRLGIARALALNPQIIFYDDPTAGLDPITSKRIIELIISFQRKRKATIITITNDMNRAFQLADRIIMVVDQSVIVTGSVADTKNHPDLRVQQFIHGKNAGPLSQLG